MVDWGASRSAFRTTRAAEALRRIVNEVPEALSVGAGTVLTPQQAQLARDAGAQFLVAPGFGPRVAVDWALDHGMAIYPGKRRDSYGDRSGARERSYHAEIFPCRAKRGGLAFIKAIAAPYVDVTFMPTGGINAANVATYLAFERIIACGGSWMAPPDWIAAKQFDRIRDEARAAYEIAHGRTPAVHV